MRVDLTDRVLVVTGASSGIGAATALEAARAGMHVVVSARRTAQLEAVAGAVRALGRRALAVACDVTSDRQVRDLMAAADHEFGRLDAVFANAGYGLFAAALETTDRQMRDIFEVNFYGTVRVVQAAAPLLRRQGGGQVLICSSAASEVGVPMYSAYAATKAAQDGWASALRAELADEGIVVTTVHPMPTETEFFDAMKGRTADPESVRRSPSPVTQTPQHVARCIVAAMKKPRPEVWPHWPSRLGAGIATAFPSLPARVMRRHMRRLRAGGGVPVGRSA